MAVEYQILNLPLLARNLAGSRTPRVQRAVPAEYGEKISRDVAAGIWSTDENGEGINDLGQTLQDDFEAWLAPRPHALMPVVIEDASSDCWLEGNITKQGARLKHLVKYCNGIEAAGLAMFREEAAAHNVKPFTTQKGTKPGEKQADKKSDSGPPLSQNPWSDKWRGTPAEALAEQTRIMRSPLGTKGATSIARAAGKTVLGALLK